MSDVPLSKFGPFPTMKAYSIRDTEGHSWLSKDN